MLICHCLASPTSSALRLTRHEKNRPEEDTASKMKQWQEETTQFVPVPLRSNRSGHSHLRDRHDELATQFTILGLLCQNFIREVPGQ